MNGKVLSLVLISFAFIAPIEAQNPQAEGYHISVELPGIKDTTVILAHRYGDKFFTDDTLRTDQKGIGIFQNDKSLPHGMYQIVLPDRSFFDFFIDDDQKMALYSKPGQFVANNTAKGHKINQLFFDWHRATTTYQGKPEINQVWDTTLQRAGSSLMGKFLKGIRPFHVPPELSKDSAWQSNQEMQYHYYKNHFFDQIDLTDPGLLRTPLVYNKLNQFFSKVVPPRADSIIKYSEDILGITKKVPEAFRFSLQFLLNYYAEPKIMGTDAVYVYLADTYYLSGIADWVDEQNLKLIEERCKELRPLLIGKTAPALPALQTPDGEFIQIFESKAKWSIFYFWEPDCGHCKTTTPQLHKLNKQIESLGGEIFAINTRLDKDSWIKFIAEHELDWNNLYSPDNVREVLYGYQAWGTPKIFILDKKHKIIAKDLTVEQVVDFLTHLNRISGS